MQGNVFAKIGEIKGEAFVDKGKKDNEIVKTDINSMLESYKSPMGDF
jgi:hypothetical protein